MLSIDLKDKLLLLMSATLAVYASFMLVQPDHVGLSSSIESSPPIAEVKTYSNVVKKKPVQSLSWKNINSENKLFQGDQIFTHDDSFAEIVYKNSTSINLLPNTLLKIEESEEGVNVDLQKGFLSLNFNKNATKNLNLRVGKKSLAISSKDATFQISSIKNKSQITLVKGKARIGAGKNSKVLKNGDSIKIDANKKEIEITRVDIFPLAPRIGATVNTLEGPVEFKWKAKANGEVSFKILLSMSPTLSSPQIFETKEKSYRLNYLKPGSYYWKVTSEVNGKSFEGPVSNFKIPLPSPPLLVGPNSKSIIQIGMKQKQAKVELKWKGSYPKGFLVAIKPQDGEVKTLSSQSNQLTLNDISSAIYSWKVKANENGAPWSSVSQFEVKRENYLKPVLPEPEQQINILSLKEKIKFQWVGLKEELYKFQIFKDLEMKEVLYTKELKGTNHSIGLKKFGNYFWMVSSKAYPEITTKPQAFSLKASIASLISPKDKSKFIMLQDDKKIRFKFKNLGLKTYPSILQVSMNESFDEVLSSTKIKRSSLTLPFDIQGEYFWRIIPEKKSSDSLSSSDIRSFKLSLPPAPKPPRIAMKQLLEFLKGYNIEQYAISWPTVKYGKEYVIEIYDGNNLKKRLTRAKVKSTKILWRGERSGAFYYRVKVIDNWGRESKWSKLGKLIAPISPFD